MIAALVLVALTVGTPFEDIEKRFSVDLPAGWSFAPQPGDVGGAYFRRTVEGMIANATVRIIPFTTPIDLASFAGQMAAAVELEPGYRLLQSQNVTLAGQAALRRRFVMSINGDPKWPKMVEQRFIVAGDTGYVVHVETVADAFGVFESDFNKLFDSFRPGPLQVDAEVVSSPGAPVVAAPPVKPGKTRRAKQARRADARVIIGRWEGGGHALQLSPGGVVTFDAIHGTYTLDNGSLVLRVMSQQLVFGYQINGETLRVSGGQLGDGQNFHRVSGPSPGASGSGD